MPDGDHGDHHHDDHATAHLSGIAGGSVYDALVGAAAAEHGIVLATRDRRALDIYRSLDVEVEMLVDRNPGRR